MTRTARHARALATLATLAVLVAAPGRHASRLGAQTVPRCLEADVKMVSKVDSAFAIGGDAFIFRLAGRVNARGNVPDIPAGTRGYGIVSYADHAHGAGTPGRLVIEPRFLTLPDGKHVPVLADPQLTESFVQGQSRNVNGALGFVPGFGLAVTGYNALHRGRETVIAEGTIFRVIVGDDLPLGQCFVPPPSAPDIR
ncbi:MAG: hypothetical protein NVS2B8_19680 [Vulcanimicrobiaceae bacterium]